MYKRLYHQLIYIILPGFIAFVMGCASATRITDTWHNPDFPSPEYKRIFVAALISDITARQTIEDEMAIRLERQGIQAVKSTEALPPDFTENLLNDKEAILSKVREENSDAILTVSVIDEETDTRYVADNVTYNPTLRFGFYGDFWGYYSHYSPMLYDPGYYVKDKVYFLETNLYDVGSEKLVWSAQSRSYNPADVEMFSAEVAETTIEELEQDELI